MRYHVTDSDPFSVSTFTQKQVSVSDFLTLFSARTDGPFFSARPGWLLLFAGWCVSVRACVCGRVCACRARVCTSVRVARVCACVGSSVCGGCARHSTWLGFLRRPWLGS